MITVTFRLKNPPANSGIWSMIFFTKTPFSTPGNIVSQTYYGGVNDPLYPSIDETMRFMLVRTLKSVTYEQVSSFETTTPFIFVDGGVYTWDCATNTLIEEGVVPPVPPVEGLGLAIAAAAVLGLGTLALVGMAKAKK